jgi:acetyl/propionyl-CoA carboxylase alpha subunit
LKLFKSILVANRGEIACRVFRTARAMGMRCIAVHSDADARAKHVREADEAVRLGPAPAAESYLRGDLIIAAAKATGAEAIHPGYGFLSENPDFAEAVVKAGLIWIGPTPAAIRAMGLKDEAKRIAIAADVPVLPGYQGEDQSERRLLKAAKEIGFPVLIKAVAGGGGRGIREVTGSDDFSAALASAQREAKAAFGDDRVLVEKLVQRPRHIEVQVFGDSHGDVVHFFERDCSLQRRRQKVIEEAPAPGMTDEVRAAMTSAAVKVAKAVGYQNAGTVEFIVDGTGPLRPDGFWFLEMNTRLQVEHCVTEEIVGRDLVKLQFEVACGGRVPLQDEISMSGHAVELRLCAEDPAQEYRPSVGRITRFETEVERWGLRLDSGFEAGDLIPPNYDSLLAKLIFKAQTRTLAFGEAMACLTGLEVGGVQTNAGLLYAALAATMADDQIDVWNEGPEYGLHTGLLAANTALTKPPNWQTEDSMLCAAAVAVQLEREYQATLAHDPFAAADGWRLNAPPRLEAGFQIEGARRAVALSGGAASVLARVGEGLARASRASAIRDESGAWDIEIAMPGADLLSVRAWIDHGIAAVNAQGWIHEFQLDEASGDTSALEAGDTIAAPLPGKVVALAAKAGQAVKKGEALVTLEAMKMEHALKAPRDGVVAEVGASAGDLVKEGAVLVRLAAKEEAA